MCSNFWMFLGEGTKRWICFHPEDAPLLSPRWDDPEQIDRFPSLAELEADEQSAASLREARRLEFELQAGEVLYIPHNTPHEVTNLAATCAVSANYLDQTNVELALAQGAAKLERREPGSARHASLQAMMAALGEVEWPALADDLNARGGGEEGSGAPVGHFAAHERLRCSRPVTICAP